MLRSVASRTAAAVPTADCPDGPNLEAHVSSPVLVSGPTGKVGRRLIPLLTRREVTVRTASRSPLPERAGIEPVHFDWTDESTYETARKGVRAMYLMPGPIPQPAHADHIRALLDGAAEAGVARVVVLSTYGVDQAPPENPLRRIEMAVESSGVPYTILRPAAFMQNFSEGLRWRESLVDGIRERDEIAAPGGDGVVSYVSTEDVAAIAAVALTEDGHEGRAYAPVGPESLTLTEVAEHISWATGRRIRYTEVDQTHIRDALLATGAPPETAEHNSRMYVHAVSSGALGVRNDDVFHVTGQPPVSFAQFAIGAAAAWRR
jgi:uncharacterized protein YbjT (DUF2867 family)